MIIIRRNDGLRRWLGRLAGCDDRPAAGCRWQLPLVAGTSSGRLTDQVATIKASRPFWRQIGRNQPEVWLNERPVAASHCHHGCYHNQKPMLSVNISLNRINMGYVRQCNKNVHAIIYSLA